MKKDKKYKLKSSQEEDIKAVKTFIDNYVSRSELAQFVTYSDFYASDYYCFYAQVQYENFKAKIIFNTGVLFTENCFDIKYIFENSPFEYSIYDIFNLFNIGDFNVYYYYNCYGKSFLTSAAGRLVLLTERYMADIERAGTPQYINTLENYFRQDKIMCSGENWKENLALPSEFDYSHIIYAANAGDKQKMLAGLREKQAKNKINTIYEKRLLAYLEQGYLPGKCNELVDETEKQFTSLKRKVNAAIFFGSMVLILIATAIFYALTFHGAFVPPDAYFRFAGQSIPVYEHYIFALLNGLFLFFFIKGFFSKKIIMRFANENNKVFYSRKFDKDSRENNKAIKVCNRILCLFSLLVAVVFSMSVVTNIGFYDDCCKLCEGPLIISEIDYEDADIYLVESYSVSDNDKTIYGDYSEYVYVIADDESYFQLPDCKKDDGLWKTIENIVSAYDKEVKHIRSIDDIYNLYYGENE